MRVCDDTDSTFFYTSSEASTTFRFIDPLLLGVDLSAVRTGVCIRREGGCIRVETELGNALFFVLYRGIGDEG